MSDKNRLIKLSIIIPSYGRPEKISKAIDSIPNDTRLEIIVVDDNGIDSHYQILTQNTLKEYIQFNKIKYLPLEKNSGACIARNKGVSVARGDFVTFLDDDDEILPKGLLDKLQYCIDNQEDMDICGSNMKVSYNGEFISKSYAKFRAKSAKSFLLNGNCYTPMILIKRKSFIDIGGFSPAKRYQDHVFIIKSFLNDLKISTFDVDTFIHNVHSGERISNNYNHDNPNARINFENQLMNKVELSNEEVHTLKLEQKYLTFDEYRHARLSSFKFWYRDIFVYSKCRKEKFRAIKKVIVKMIPERIYLYVKYKFVF